MSISSTVVTDDWRWLDIGDVSDNTTAMIKRGLSGTAVFTPVGLTGVAVEDEPEWIAVAQPRTAQYTLGRLVGGDGVKGVRLISEVNGHPVVWRIERALRWNGQAIPGIEPVKAIFAGESNHLPDLVPIAADSETTVTDALVTVSSFIAAAETAASSAAADAAATASDATATAADRTATGQARTQAWSAADRAAAAATTATTQADRAKTEADRAESFAESADVAAVQAVTDRVDTLLAGAPEAYDTLLEIATKLAGQDDVASALTSQIAGKADTTDADGKKVARYESGSSQWIKVGDNGYNGGQYMNGGAINLRSADFRYASKTDLAGVQDTANAALPASKIQVVSMMPANPVGGTIYLVTGGA
ncbi:MAG: hypothetical protein LKG15_07880 [Corynebacterium provencense]|jgi:hypothetical protein|uniref:hypothetical protein n=1 Tax=Corynebacterium provencense TaxID=1737425 RepID=UPI002989F349|nr:hypothetical protein [Corynebacterium provencense]